MKRVNVYRVSTKLLQSRGENKNVFFLYSTVPHASVREEYTMQNMPEYGFSLTPPCSFLFVEIFHFVEIQSTFCAYLRTDWNFWTKFGRSDPSFIRSILILLNLRFEISLAAAQIAVSHIAVNTYYLQVS